jgi:hypothetical protein
MKSRTRIGWIGVGILLVALFLALRIKLNELASVDEASSAPIRERTPNDKFGREVRNERSRHKAASRGMALNELKARWEALELAGGDQTERDNLAHESVLGLHCSEELFLLYRYLREQGISAGTVSLLQRASVLFNDPTADDLRQLAFAVASGVFSKDSNSHDALAGWLRKAAEYGNDEDVLALIESVGSVNEKYSRVAIIGRNKRLIRQCGQNGSA